MAISESADTRISRESAPRRSLRDRHSPSSLQRQDSCNVMRTSDPSQQLKNHDDSLIATQVAGVRASDDRPTVARVAAALSAKILGTAHVFPAHVLTIN